jgi:hypothetical protein
MSGAVRWGDLPLIEIDLLDPETFEAPRSLTREAACDQTGTRSKRCPPADDDTGDDR